MRPSVGIIGAGRVGSALAQLCSAQSWQIAAVYSRDQVRSAALARAVHAPSVSHPHEVIERADLTLLTVSDDAIALLAADLARQLPADLPGHAVVHTSGAHGQDVLAPLSERGLMTGSLHPAYPFTGTPVVDLTGVAFAVETDAEPLRAWLYALVEALGGRMLVIPPGQKPLYHAALVFTSNYAVALYALAERLMTGIGADRAAADAALTALLRATVENIAAHGIPDALTGPLVRGDVSTIDAHLRALEALDTDAAALYRALALATLPLAAARGVETASLRQRLEALFSQK